MFYMTAPLKVLLLASRGDVAVAKTDPPIISVPVIIAAKLRGARRVNWLQDLIPAVAIALGMRLGGVPMQAILTWIRATRADIDSQWVPARRGCERGARCR